MDKREGTISRRSFVASTSAPLLAANLSLRPAEAAEATVEARPQRITLDVNGTAHALTIDPRVTLLDALRDRIGLTGTKKGCDQGTCGACTVLVSGRRINSCLTLAVMHEHEPITTIEGLARGETLHPLQQAFVKHDGFQCGFCTPGQIVSAAGMLNEGHALDAETVRVQMSGNLCRCGCYPHIVDAVLEAGRA